MLSQPHEEDMDRCAEASRQEKRKNKKQDRKGLSYVTEEAKNVKNKCYGLGHEL